MSLISTARALDDQRFLWRVRAAMLNLAVTKYTSTDAADRELSREILDNPMMQNKTMEALIAQEAPIHAAVVTDQLNAVNTEAVTDAQITTAVAKYWPSVAARRAELRSAAAPVV